ncbi:hypothetical protein [Sporolactobacillus putidus]|nr:hypothetical protein [Sporolactobacillus putidus]
MVHPTEMDTYESFKYSATPLEKNKSGYGDSTNVDVNYDNALGSDYQYSYKYDKSNKLTFSISDKMKVSGDTADLWSEDPSTHGTSGSNVTAKMDDAVSSRYALGIGDYTQSDSYQFPQVYSEHETGAMHASNPSGQYVSGGHVADWLQ